MPVETQPTTVDAVLSTVDLGDTLSDGTRVVTPEEEAEFHMRAEPEPREEAARDTDAIVRDPFYRDTEEPPDEEPGEEEEPITDAPAREPNISPTLPQPDNPLPANFKLPKKALTIGQVFSQLEAYTSDAEKVAWLRYNDRGILRYLLRLGYEPSAEWIIPKGLPPYTPLQIRRSGRVIALKPGTAPTELFLEARRLYLFVKGGADSMDRMKREKVFQQMIEDMEPIEVDVLLSIKDKHLEKFVSREAVATAFPGLLDGPFQLRFIRR